MFANVAAARLISETADDAEGWIRRTDIAQIEYDFLPSLSRRMASQTSPIRRNGRKIIFCSLTWGSLTRWKGYLRIPQDSGPMAFIYNKKIRPISDNGPATWDEFAQQAEKLSKASGGKVKMANFMHKRSWLISLGWAGGGQFFKTQVTLGCKH